MKLLRRGAPPGRMVGICPSSLISALVIFLVLIQGSRTSTASSPSSSALEPSSSSWAASSSSLANSTVLVHHHQHHHKKQHHQHHHFRDQNGHKVRHHRETRKRRTADNQHEPKFTHKEYRKSVHENIPIHTSILQVHATDDDLNRNGLIHYSVNNPNFMIDEGGVIYNIRPLDYEHTKGEYVLEVTAEDQGDIDQRKRSRAKAIIRVQDTPEPPIFESDEYNFSVTEFAEQGAYVGTVVARDNDGDFNRYELEGAGSKKFTIGKDNGIIVVREKDFENEWSFTFVAKAIDDRGQSATVQVTVAIIDENTNKPIFPNCESYDGVTVSENETPGKDVILVTATDADHGINGKVTYMLLNPYDSFEIQTLHEQGQIKTTRKLDRDEKDKEFFLTVIAKDSATDPLQESCSFRVIVNDVNDNPPAFDQEKYDQNIATDHTVGSPVLRVTATDVDAGVNSEVVYSLDPDDNSSNDMEYFSITQDNGIISLAKGLSESWAGKKTFVLNARATDKGLPPRHSTAPVNIKVVNSGSLPPSVVDKIFIDDKLPEDTPVNTDVVIVCAKSNMESSDNVYFTLVNGNTRDTNSDGTFGYRRLPDDDSKCVDGSKGAVIYLALRNLDYEDITTYKLILQVANDMNARADEQIIVNIKDVNDNPPILQNYEGSIVENNDQTLIVVIQAQDKDISEEFRELTYYFGDEASRAVREKFRLTNDGQLWTREPLDREEDVQYRIPIRVSDKAYNGSNTYWITVQDVNDVAPEFDKEASVYEVNLPESRDVDKDTGIDLVVIDPDVVNHNDFQIVSGNEQQKFRINQDTGDIVVNRELDYDDPGFDRNFTLKVRLSDGANAPAEIDVVIAITNENDQQPVFDQSNYTFTVTENVDCDYHFGDVKATDPDLPPHEDQHILYWLYSSDMKNFSIGKTSGELKTLGCLDREKAKRGITFYPRAMDDDGKGHDAEPANVHLTILDLNDNHPFIQSPPESYALIMENSDPTTVKPIAILLSDDDTEENGCPCKLEFADFTDPDIISKFSVQIANETASQYHLKPLKILDREHQKKYEIPFKTTDKKGVNGIRYLTLEVGDENDSPMTDGSSTIQVYNYQGQFPAIMIGTVYVSDLDDHDIGDKVFDIDATTPPETEPYFYVNHDTGEITMKKGTPEGEHVLRVKVHDKFRNETAIGDVSIIVVDLTEDAVMQSGSFRVAGYTALELITQKDLVSFGTSMYDRLKEEIGKIHGISSSNVDLFGLQDVEGGVDVRYNCHSSPYYTMARLDGLMMSYRTTVMESLSIDIPLVDNNLCLYESHSPCNMTSCQHSLRPNLTNPMLLSSQTSTVVGIDISDDYICSCDPLEPLPSVCYDGFCYNSGICDDTNNTLVCQCLDNYNYGPRCELLSARFEKGYSWYEPFTVCDNSSIFLSFDTRESSGILMYAGPTVTRPWSDYPRDFLYVVLNDWKVESYFDFGTGSASVMIPLEKNTDREFNYTVKWDQKSIIFEVVNCLGNNTVENPDCRVSVALPGNTNPSYLLNVQGALQLGGVAAMVSFKQLKDSYGWSLTPPSIDPFYGCILELRHNDYLYDLNSTDYGKNTYMPCDAPETARIVLGEQSIIIIVVSLLCLLLLVLLILCLARRRQKSISYPDLDGIVKETIGGTDLEGFGEKDMDQYDLKLLRVGPNGHLFTVGEETRRLPDVAEDARHRKAPLAQMPEGLSIGDFIDDNIKKVDKDPTDFDDVRHYCFEGDEMSIASLSSIGSGGSSDSESEFDYRNDWGHRFEKLSSIYRRESDEDDDSEYEFNIPRQPKRYSLHQSPTRDNPTGGNPTASAADSSPTATAADKSSGRPPHSPTVTFADPETQGSREGLLPDEPDEHHEAVNPLATFGVEEGKESWC